MTRMEFLTQALALGSLSSFFSLSDLSRLLDELPATDRMPSLFVGHGNPLYAIRENPFSQTWAQLGKELPRPRAILCISAHWETRGTFVTAMSAPPTIHDFGGFPRELYEVEYPAPGEPRLAQEICTSLQDVGAQTNLDWGLDHGCWSVLRNMYPEAGVPVLQLSLDASKPPEWHFQLGRMLASWRQKGVLILGSGNLVHNLRLINWEEGKPYDWALEARNKIREWVLNEQTEPLIHYTEQGNDMRLAVPTPEHFLPLLYVEGTRLRNDETRFFNDAIDMGSIAMTGVIHA